GQFAIKIDTEDKILELYEDNNYYSLPFYVQSDTTRPDMEIKIDGSDILDGDFISASPTIRIELSDPSELPITDTASVTLSINDTPIYYSDPARNDIVSLTNPKYVVEYTPTLDDGAYTLKVNGKDGAGNEVSPEDIVKKFTVSSETRLFNVYNYPNPFQTETYFTFKLPQIPDELKIKIYTIAGRLKD
ncbi:MAG: hypothetical protein GXO87_08590, partial [Chlorobi bacterium]|nr:hypothetical protein [Chlorobiota bacterium]